MCGIVGYVGEKQAAPILLDGLSKLEYRGYDSAGIAVYDGAEIQTEKSKGRLKVLSELTHDGQTMPGTIGIGHTRWATHGEPSDVNAHPHYNKNKNIVVVHNGIIENYLKLKQKLEKKGYEFVSETDTEVLAHLLDYYYQGNPLQAITKVMHRVEGSYALGIMFQDHPDELYAVRKDSPLIVGETENGCVIASDVPAVLKYTRDVYFIENEEIVRMEKDSMQFFNVDEEEIEKTPEHIEWDANAAEKGGYEHFMLKEMYEQPKAILDTFSPRIKGNDIVIEELGMSDEEIMRKETIYETCDRDPCPLQKLPWPSGGGSFEPDCPGGLCLRLFRPQRCGQIHHYEDAAGACTPHRRQRGTAGAYPEQSKPHCPAAADRVWIMLSPLR